MVILLAHVGTRPNKNLSFPKIPSGLDRMQGQNRCIMRSDISDPACAWNACRRSVQVAEPEQRS
jgi:hypothetical protein